MMGWLALGIGLFFVLVALAGLGWKIRQWGGKRMVPW